MQGHGTLAATRRSVTNLCEVLTMQDSTVINGLEMKSVMVNDVSYRDTPD